MQLTEVIKQASRKYKELSIVCVCVCYPVMVIACQYYHPPTLTQSSTLILFASHTLVPVSIRRAKNTRVYGTGPHTELYLHTQQHVCCIRVKN